MNFLYRVYDAELKKYLLEQGQRYELKAIDIVTHKKMWVFINTNELQKLVEEDLLEVDLDDIKLTKKGLDLANLVWEEFI